LVQFFNCLVYPTESAEHWDPSFPYGDVGRLSFEQLVVVGENSARRFGSFHANARKHVDAW
jgi:hypothetical protein